MPWRRDFAVAFWIDPNFVGFSGYPKEGEPPAPPEPREPEEAVLIMRDRIGFQYERRVRLEDYVSQRDAAKLMGLNLMTVNRWVRSNKLPSRKRKGFKVVRVSDVLRVARETGRTLPMRALLVIRGMDQHELNWIPGGENE